MKKYIVIVLLLFNGVLFAQSFVNPIGFVSSEANKQKVISFIKKQVQEDYSKVGMDDPLTLRMMENENLNAFKKLTKKTNTRLLKRVIKTYCEVGMCNYTTILMMFNEQNKASIKNLKW